MVRFSCLSKGHLLCFAFLIRVLNRNAASSVLRPILNPNWASPKKLFSSAIFIDLLHIILTQVYPIGWKRRIFHFHPTSVWSYRICKFWCWVRIKYVNLQKCPPIVHTSIFFKWFKDNLPRKIFFVPFHPKLRLQTKP